MAAPKLQKSTSEDSLYRKSPSRTGKDSVIGQSKSFAVFSKTSRDSVNREGVKPTPIPSLLSAGGPVTIFLKVALGVVESINGFVRWSLSHIIQKITEIIPPLAHRDSSTSINMPVDSVWIGTPLNHAHPRSVRSGVRVAMLPTFIFGTLGGKQATTAFTISYLQAPVEFEESGGSTITLTHTSGSFPNVRGVSDNKDLAKALTDKGFFSRHNIRSNVVFSGTRGLQPTECCELYG